MSRIYKVITTPTNFVPRPQAGTVPLPNLEGHAAAGETFGLVVHGGHRFATDAYVKLTQPGMQAFTQFDLAEVGPQGFRLQV